MFCKGTLFYWYSEVTILHVWGFLTFGLSLLVTFNYYPKQKTKKTIHYPTLPAKTLCSIPSTHLQGFRNYMQPFLKVISEVQYEHNFIRVVCWSMSCYVLYRHVLLFSFTHCRRHSVASVFHCEDLFLHWSSLSRVLTVGATQYFLWCQLFKPPCS